MVGQEADIAVYIMTNRKHGTLYIGVTSQLLNRTHQHRLGQIDGFTQKYGLKRLVWFERSASMTAAIQCEKSMKRWPRDWKANLIERDNPDWDDLFPALCKQYGVRVPD